MKGETADNTEKIKYAIAVSANQILNNIMLSYHLHDFSDGPINFDRYEFCVIWAKRIYFFSLSCLQSLLSPPHFL